VISDLSNDLIRYSRRIIIVSDREGLGIGLGLGIIDRRSEPDRRSEAISFGAC